MFKILIFVSILVLTNAKPLTPEDDETLQKEADRVAGTGGYTFGDKLDWYNPTTPRDAANRFSLSYAESTFPEKPNLDDPKFNHDQPPADKKPVRRRRNNDAQNIVSSVIKIDRPVRKAEEEAATTSISAIDAVTPTIPLKKIVNAVENTLVHAAENIVAATNITTLNVTKSELFTSETSTTTTTTTTESPEIPCRKRREVGNFASLKTIVNKMNLPILAPIAVDAQNVSIVKPSTDTPSDESMETGDMTTIVPEDHAEKPKVSVIQSVNSTQVITAGSTLHVQQNKITLFSVGPGALPVTLPAIHLEDITSKNESTSKLGSSESTSTQTPLTTTVHQSMENKRKETEKLKEKLAEVEADPVILTQGI